MRPFDRSIFYLHIGLLVVPSSWRPDKHLRSSPIRVLSVLGHFLALSRASGFRHEYTSSESITNREVL